VCSVSHPALSGTVATVRFFAWLLFWGGFEGLKEKRRKHIYSRERKSERGD
jgi:hypothetical protein